MPATGETEPAAAPQRHWSGQDGVVEEQQLGRQQRAEVFGEIVRRRRRRRRQRARQQQQQNVADDKRRCRRCGRGRRDELDGRQLARVHRHVAVVQSAVAARRWIVVHQADTERHAATTAVCRVPPEFRRWR